MDNPGGRRDIPDPPRRVTVAASPWLRAAREPITWFAALASVAAGVALYLEFSR